jgi:sulfide:quinone oxidoreductase
MFKGVTHLHLTKSEDNTAAHRPFAAGEASFDLLIGVPPHRAPQAVREAGLTDETGWIPVDLQILETKHTDVFAIGDITSIRQPNPTGFYLPKAWVFADEEARIVARNIASKILGEAEAKKFDGTGSCYLETGETWRMVRGIFMLPSTPCLYGPTLQTFSEGGIEKV